MTISFQNTHDVEMPWTTWFFFGATGTGKTERAATFPSPLFLIPANEGSHVTLLRKQTNFQFVSIGKDPKQGRIPVRMHMAQILSDLEQRHTQMHALLLAGKQDEAYAVFPWETIVVESLTHYCDLVVEDISKFGTAQMDQRGWGQLATHIRTIHDRLRSLDVHVVYTSLDKVDAKEGSPTIGKPNITGSMADKLPSACDVIAYCEITRSAKNEQVFRTHFTRRPPFDARARFPFPDYVDDFSFASLAPLMVPTREQQVQGTQE